MGLCRGARWAQSAIEKLEQESSAKSFVVSIVSIAETNALAHRNSWGQAKLQQLNQLFNGVPVIAIGVPVIAIDDHKIASTFADMTNWTHARASSRIVSQPYPTPARVMRDNDLWIAATTHCIGATLASTDKDFLHLKDIWFPFAYVSQSIR